MQLLLEQMEMFRRTVYFSHFSQKQSEELSVMPLALLWFFPGYVWIIDHISLKEWQLTDQ